jgi:phosphohistidine phosphatase SixA
LGGSFFVPSQDKTMPARHRLLLILLFPLLATCQPRGNQEETLVFLVRHAERADDGGMASEEDPHLSAAGEERAEVLARMLKDAGITHIHSSDYLRTRETAAPLAAATGLDVSTYDARDLESFAAELLATPGRHLVVGHSNSTPELVAALGGEPYGEIESMEYDRLYLVSICPGKATTALLGFGAPFEGTVSGAGALTPATGGLPDPMGRE